MGSPGCFQIICGTNTWKWRAWLINKPNSKGFWSLKHNLSADSCVQMAHFPAVNCRGCPFIKSRKISSHFSNANQIYKIFLKVELSYLLTLINISFFEMSIQLILIPLFPKPHPTHPVSWSNMLIRMVFLSRSSSWYYKID